MAITCTWIGGPEDGATVTIRDKDRPIKVIYGRPDHPEARMCYPIRCPRGWHLHFYEGEVIDLAE
jgi:hypothetical protein